MGRIIEELLSEIKDSNIDIRVKKICDKIQEEEEENIIDKDEKPKGANIFLALQIKPQSKGISFLTLERESPENYFVGLYTKKRNKKTSMKRIKTWEIRESTPDKILKGYGKLLKFVNSN